MNRKLQIKSVPNTWLENGGRRLDCGPYMSGAIEATELLKRMETENLSTLTKGYNGGIYNGPQFVRNYVEDPTYGVPFLTTSTMLQADMRNLPMISAKDAHSSKLSYLKVEEGMSLITCSGSIGRMSYARKDMADCWSNQDIMKVVPDPHKILSGYLYAFLSSRFGVPIVVSGTYGAIIQHIEPHHIADLPVPRLGEIIEQKAHDLVERSATLLDKYQARLNEATELYFDSVGLKDITSSEWHSWGSDLGFAVTAGVQSLRALNFNPRFQRICELIKQGPWKPLGELCESGTLETGPRFKRIDADPEYGFQLIGQKQIFWLRPEGRWIAKKFTPKRVMVPCGTTLVAAHGTLSDSELYCRAEYITGSTVERAYSQDFLRVIGNENIIQRGALYAFLRSETAFRMFRSASTGSKLQEFHYEITPMLPIPFPPKDIRQRCHLLVEEAYIARERAIQHEDAARLLVENSIEEGSY
jgi:Restriction endonuclease S subunits